jgi:hypothetical protein
VEELQETISGLDILINDMISAIGCYSEEELSRKPSPNKWSKKEILGHLCDSANNNIQRLIRV